MTATPARAGLDELDALLAAATPGEWQYDPSEGDTVWDGDEKRPSIIALTRDPYGNCEADAALIVALRNAAPAMLAAIRAAYALAEDWRGWPAKAMPATDLADALRAALDEALGASGE